MKIIYFFLNYVVVLFLCSIEISYEKWNDPKVRRRGVVTREVTQSQLRAGAVESGPENPLDVFPVVQQNQVVVVTKVIEI